MHFSRVSLNNLYFSRVSLNNLHFSKVSLSNLHFSVSQSDCCFKNLTLSQTLVEAENLRRFDNMFLFQSFPCFWPRTVGSPTSFGPLTIELMEENIDDNIASRLFKIKKVNKSHHNAIIVYIVVSI